MWPLLKHDCTLNATKQKSSLSSANKVVLVYKYKSIIRSKRYDLWQCKFSEMGRVVWASERSAIYLKRYQNLLRNLTDAFVSARSVHPIPQNSDLWPTRTQTDTTLAMATGGGEIMRLITNNKFTPQTPARHDKTVLSSRNWRCELDNNGTNLPLHNYGLFTALNRPVTSRPSYRRVHWSRASSSRLDWLQRNYTMSQKRPSFYFLNNSVIN